jgi:hypothetical protein
VEERRVPIGPVSERAADQHPAMGAQYASQFAGACVAIGNVMNDE